MWTTSLGNQHRRVVDAGHWALAHRRERDPAPSASPTPTYTYLAGFSAAATVITLVPVKEAAVAGSQMLAALALRGLDADAAVLGPLFGIRLATVGVSAALGGVFLSCTCALRPTARRISTRSPTHTTCRSPRRAARRC